MQPAYVVNLHVLMSWVKIKNSLFYVAMFKDTNETWVTYGILKTFSTKVYFRRSVEPGEIYNH